MGIEKLFKKVEKFFDLDKELQDKKQKKKQKLIDALEDKIALLKKKMQDSDNKNKRKEHKIQIKLMKEFLAELD